METKKTVFLPATIAIILLTEGDMLTSSSGHDENDNWSDDIFSGSHL